MAAARYNQGRYFQKRIQVKKMSTELAEMVRTNPEIAAMREKITRIGALMFERRLTDAGGGNISVRVGEYILITPRFSGSKRQWRLRPDEVLVADKDMNILDGQGEISRESKAHFRLHHEFGEYGLSVIHAHARNILVFAAMNMAMPMVLEGTIKFGTIPVVGYGPAHSADLAENIAGAIRGNEARIRKHAAAAIAPWHGVFVMGRDLEAAFDAVERLDNNAYCILMGQLLKQSDLLADQRGAMEAALAKYQE
jgi:L-fuculose-phosphate aldolase